MTCASAAGKNLVYSPVEVSAGELLDRGEVPDDFVLVRVPPRPQNHEAVILVHRDAEFKLLHAVDHRVQKLEEGFGGGRQEYEQQADRHELGKQQHTAGSNFVIGRI